MTLDDILRMQIRHAPGEGADSDGVARQMILVLPDLCDRRRSHALVELAYDRRNSDLDRSTPGRGDENETDHSS